MIWAWLTDKVLGMARGLWVLIALVALLVWLSVRDDHNRDIGAMKQRETDLRETLNRTKDADDARETMRRDDAVRYSQCLRTARTPENCQRFLHGVEADNR